VQRNDVAPDVELLDQNGTRRKLSAIAEGRRIVLFFYPAAMTTGCTKESCHFRDLAREFDEVSAVRIGISLDTVEKQHRFSEANGLDFTLLSDVEGEAARAFQVKRPLSILKVRRTTFVLDEGLRVIAVINSEFDMHRHADQALELLRATPARNSG
jgi:thioredoxin-dependent peroxiredoxin